MDKTVNNAEERERILKEFGKEMGCLILTRRSRCMQSYKDAKSFCSDGVGGPTRRFGPRFGSVLPLWSLQLLAIHVAGALWGADQRDPGNPPRQEHCHAVRILGLSVDLSRQLG